MNRLLILTQYYKPEIGAPQNRLLEMALGLKDLGWDVRVQTGMPNYPTGKIFPAYRGRWRMKEELDGIPVRRTWFYASNSKRSFPRIISMLSFSFNVLFSCFRIRRFRPHFLVVESPPLLLALSARYLARWSGAKLVMNVSDLWPLSAKELGAISEGRLYRLLEGLEGHLYRKSAFCMGQSSEIVSYMEEHGARLSYLFRNGVDPRRFASAGEEGVSPRSGIVYTGLLGVAQGIVSICREINFRDLGTHLSIYGSGPEQEELEAYLEAHPDRGIRYCGQVSREEIPAILLQHEASLIPLVGAIYGAVPSKIYESMAAGLPILFSGKGEAVEIIREYDLGWISDPGDHAMLKLHIGHLAAERGDLEKKRENCLRAARDHFNRPRQVKALHHFLLGEKNTGG